MNLSSEVTDLDEVSVPGIDARIAIFCAVIWLMIAYTTRYSSAAALSAAIAAPFAGLLFLGPTFAVGVLVVIAAVLIWRHKANIARLRAGNPPGPQQALLDQLQAWGETVATGFGLR